MKYIGIVFYLLGSLIPAALAQHTFTADFNDGSPSAFVPRYGHESAWLVRQGALSQTAPTGLNYAYLHVFSLNHTLSGRFKIVANGSNRKTGGFVGFLLRMNLAVPDSSGQLSGSYVQVGYDLSKKQVQIIEQEERDRPRQVRFLSAKPVALSAGTWHTFSIRTHLQTLTLTINGRELARTNALLHRTYGRVALLTNDITADFDDIRLDTPEGRVERGVLSYDSFLETGLRGESAFCRTKSGRLLRLHEGKLSESVDNERTWGAEVATFSGVNSLGGTPQLLCTHTGRLVSLRAFGNGSETTAHWAENLWIVVSDDEGRTWRKTDQISPTRAAVMADVIREVRLSNGRHRLFLFLNNERPNVGTVEMGNVQRVVYSDNDGETWQRASPSWPAAYPNEGKMVGWSDGKIRIIARPRGQVTWQGHNDTPCVDCVAYSESTDGGLTWGDWTCFDLPTNTTSLNAREDPFDPDKVYLVWNYNLSAHERNSCGPQEVAPRTRQALARYSKQAQTWAYLMDVDDWEYSSDAGPITQDVRYMNHTLFIDRDYVYLDIHRANTYAQSCRFDDKSNGYEGTFHVRKAKKDIEPYAAFPPLHYARNGIIPGLGTLANPVAWTIPDAWSMAYDSTTRQVHVRTQLPLNEQPLRYEVVAYKGQKTVKNVPATGVGQTISLTDLPNGDYYIQLKTTHRRFTKRLTNRLFN